MLSVLTTKKKKKKQANYTRKFLKVMDMFSVLIVVMVSWVLANSQSHQNIFIKYMQFFVYHNLKKFKKQTLTTYWKSYQLIFIRGFQGGNSVKELDSNAGDVRDMGSTSRSEIPGGHPGNPVQYTGLENPMDRAAWRATVHGSQRVRHD